MERNLDRARVLLLVCLALTSALACAAPWILRVARPELALRVASQWDFDSFPSSTDPWGNRIYWTDTHPSGHGHFSPGPNGVSEDGRGDDLRWPEEWWFRWDVCLAALLRPFGLWLAGVMGAALLSARFLVPRLAPRTGLLLEVILGVLAGLALALVVGWALSELRFAGNLVHLSGGLSPLPALALAGASLSVCLSRLSRFTKRERERELACDLET